MSTLAAVLPVPVVCPLAGAVLAPLAGRLNGRLPLVIGIVALLGSIATLAAVASRVYDGPGHVLSHFLSNERPQHGKALGIALAADPFGLTFALLTAALGLLLLTYVLSELGDLGRRELGGLSCLVQLLLAALIGAALTADNVNLFVWFEVAALASYGLTGFFLERPIALEAAFKNLVLTSMAGFGVFAGAALLYSSSGALNFAQLHAEIGGHPSRAQAAAMGLLVAGFATKAGLAPFHGWLPDAHTPVPGAVSALFSGLMVNLGVVALARLSLQVFPGTPGLLGLLTGVGLLSAVLGAVMALVQDDLKRLLAWDTVSQTGVLMLGYASRSAEGAAGATYHLVNHALFKGLLFLCAGTVVHTTGKTLLSEMGGLSRKMPLLTGAFTIGCLAIAGVPPLNGYASLGLIHKGLEHEPAIYAGAVVAQVVTIAALARAAYLAFYRRRHEDYEHLEPLRFGMRASLVLLGAACVGFGVGAAWLVQEMAGPAAAVLLHPHVYASGILAGGAAVPLRTVEFDYADLPGLLSALGELVVGALLAVWVVRKGAPRAIGWLRRVHTGSVNDYAAFSVAGLVITAAVLIA